MWNADLFIFITRNSCTYHNVYTDGLALKRSNSWLSPKVFTGAFVPNYIF